MSLIDAARYRLRRLFRADAMDHERDEEVAFHRSLAEANYAHATGDVEGAPYAARRELGNATYARETARWMGATRWLDQLAQDLRFAARSFRRSPGFTAVATASIGLAIGANTAIFGVINALMFERLAVQRPEELVQLWRADSAGERIPTFTAAEYDALRAASGVEIALYTFASAMRAEIGGYAENRLTFQAVDGSLFPLLGVRPAAGRLLLPSDDRDAAPVAVFGFETAVRYFGSARAAVGKHIRLQDQTFMVAGVLPREFRGLQLDWPMTIVVPWRTAPLLRNTWFQNDGNELALVARLAADSARTRLTLERAFASCCADGQLAPNRTRRPQYLGLSDISRGIEAGKFDLRAMFARVLYTLMAGVAIILLIACTNVGNLQLARATVRTREYAVRMALGASRARVVRQLLVESLLLASVGAVVGIQLAVWGTAALAGRLPGNLGILAPFVKLTPSLAMVGFTAGAAVLCTIIFGVLPAIRATRLDPMIGLRAGSPGSTRSGRLDRGIIAFQMALALVLVAAAGLLGATLRNLRSGIAHLDPDRLLVARVETQGTPIPEGGEREVHTRILERLRTVPGVSSVAGTDVMPLYFMGFTTRTLDVPGFEYERTLDAAGAGLIHVTPGFFTTTGSGLVSGREFNDRDVAGAPRVAVISETIARQFFPGRNPIGQMIGFVGRTRDIRIVGVARDVKQTDLRAPNPRTVYLSWTQRPSDGAYEFYFAMRTDRPAASVAAAARAAVGEASPDVVIRGVQPLSASVSFLVGREQALAWVALVFSLVAVGLAAVGLYGVLAFQVTSRSREIGIRMALGADRAGVVGMVMRQSLVVVVIGIAIGVPLALGASSGLRALLYGVPPFAPRPFITAVVILTAAGLLAAVLPSRNATRVDPLMAIRAE